MKAQEGAAAQAGHDGRRVDLEAYVQRLPLAAERRARLLAQAREAAGAAAQMATLHRLLAGDDGTARGDDDGTAHGDDAAHASLGARLELACQGLDDARARDKLGNWRLATAPAIRRTSMAPRHWPFPGLPRVPLVDWIATRRAARRAAQAGTPAAPFAAMRAADPGAPPALPRSRWHLAGSVRRAVLVALIIAQTWIATNFMAAVLPYHGSEWLEIALLALFALLFAWISAGFWTALMGFALLTLFDDRYAITRDLADLPPIDPAARTAVIMPICNEFVPRVYAGLRATYESLERCGQLAHFDFFILSDTSDPDIRVAEVDGWLKLCRDIGGLGRLFYRRRQLRIKRKSGNVADFCRRWGAAYRYMVVLDADSVMSGDCLAHLVQLMEAHPDAGIIQTAPRAAGRGTLFARIQQFATRVYGPIFTAGLHAWQLGESHYWGHNAIIRVAPFTQHCALGRLPGDGALSGEILSHDFVEAALMRRAGWAVWIAYDLPGSFEEMPPNLTDELKRDRRWCQGNLMNFRLLRARGLHPAHRAVFVTGLLAYVSAPLWFAFLILSTVLLAQHTLVPPRYFTQPNQLFPMWPEWHPEWAVALFGTTALLLFLPKVLSVALLAFDRRIAPQFGGRLRLAASAAVESVFSALLAPIRMLFHTRFVVAALLGWSIQWKSPPREDTETRWRDSLHHHGLHSLLGLGWASLVYWLNPSFLWWLLPVAGSMMVSIAVDVWTSRVTLGARARSAGVFVIPEESHPPRELADTYAATARTPPPPGFVAAVADPLANAVACAAAIVRVRQGRAYADRRRELVVDAACAGPAALKPAQQAALLNDPVALSMLHFLVWTLPGAHPAWTQDGTGA
ncbi:MAG TPA: glucans biosynthesis glucosyltransferase MdoH [Burkholderiaceae bacterium]|nr:glucans biosynthesis glucosyltransferase MdoH [Burkholderiaceae bacterium]